MTREDMEKATKLGTFIRKNKLAKSLTANNPILGMAIFIMLKEFYNYIVEGKCPNMEDSDNE